jgi:hypothetical protein
MASQSSLCLAIAGTHGGNVFGVEFLAGKFFHQWFIVNFRLLCLAGFESVVLVGVFVFGQRVLVPGFGVDRNNTNGS